LIYLSIHEVTDTAGHVDNCPADGGACLEVGFKKLLDVRYSVALELNQEVGQGQNIMNTLVGTVGETRRV
jgi:hypothetical protein